MNEADAKEQLQTLAAPIEHHGFKSPRTYQDFNQDERCPFCNGTGGLPKKAARKATRMIEEQALLRWSAGEVLSRLLGLQNKLTDKRWNRKPLPEGEVIQCVLDLCTYADHTLADALMRIRFREQRELAAGLRDPEE